MVKISAAEIPHLLIEEQSSAPASPAAGFQEVYIRTSDHHLVRKNSGGTVTDVEAGGGGGGDVTKADEQTPSGTGTVTLTPLGTGKHLQIRWACRTTDSAEQILNMQFNGDSTSGHYTWKRQFESNVGLSSGDKDNPTTLVEIGAVGSNSESFLGAGVVEILDYNSSLYHGYVARCSYNSSGDPLEFRAAGHFKQAAAITSITITLAAGNFQDALFSLYEYA